MDSHLVGVRRNFFNPLFGNAGKLGQRDFSAVWETCLMKAKPAPKKSKKAVTATSIPTKAKKVKKTKTQLQNEQRLRSTLLGCDDAELQTIEGAGTWFVFANKTSNSGQAWFRKGQLSPWSFLLAVEGAFLLSGDVNRRLSSKARPYAAFPFICDPAQPLTLGEVGKSQGEFWAPIWGQPTTVDELRQLLKRGLARIGNRSAHAPHEFAIAALAAGTDAGVLGFARFNLRQTTSGEVFEAVPEESISVSQVGGVIPPPPVWWLLGCLLHSLSG